MSIRTTHSMPASWRSIARFLPAIILILTLACSLPAIKKATPSLPSPTQPPTLPPTQSQALAPTQPSPTLAPTQPPVPTPTPQTLPPAIVESDPPTGAEVPLQGPITLYFNQPMDRASVESAFTRQAGVDGRITWKDDATLTFSPSTPLKPETALTFNISESARSAKGLPLTQPISLTYQTAGYLRLVQALPEPSAQEVDPSSAIVAAFNRPVVPLGAEQTGLPLAFTLEPVAQGRGEWTNTSTYIFYPEPPLEGGKAYVARLNPELRGVDGSPLAEPGTEGKEHPTNLNEWSFTTALPRLVSWEPLDERGTRLDAKFILTFNQPMDSTSVETKFSLLLNGTEPVPGTSAWNADFTVFTFTPNNLLERDTTYTISLSDEAQARGGTPLGMPLDASIQTVPALSVQSTNPGQGMRLGQYGSVTVYFTAPIQDKNVLNYIAFSPTLPNLNYWVSEQEFSINIYGDFLPNTDYRLSISPDLLDAWDEPLRQPYVLTFRTAPLKPGIQITTSSNVIFLTPQDASLIAQATNISKIPIIRGKVPLADLFTMLGSKGYEFYQNYQVKNKDSWTQTLNLTPDQTQTVELYIAADKKPLDPGIYYLKLNLAQEGYPIHPLLVVSDYQLTFKISATDALVWVVDLRQDKPLPNAPVAIYAEDGSILASGQTGADGTFQSKISGKVDPYSNLYAVLGQPDGELFGMALSSWSQGVDSWAFGIPSDYSGPKLMAYLYSDRPVYRPGDTFHFRAVVRQAYNGRYTIPDLGSLPLVMNGPNGEELAKFDLPLSVFGTGHGEYTLPKEAQPGYYNLNSQVASYAYLSFQVADYRKPEINLQVAFSAEQVLAGQALSASVNARYYFDAPAGNVKVHWVLYSATSYFYLPGYQVGVEDTRWMNFSSYYFDPLGKLVSEGDAETTPEGTLALDFPTEKSDSRLKYSLEITAKDESGLPVSARTSIELNPAEFYIGVRPEAWSGRAGEESAFQVQVVDWQKEPAGIRSLHAEYQKVIWVREDPPATNPYVAPTYTPQYTQVGSADVQTDAEGQARLSFTPPEPGTYQLTISGDGAHTEILTWVGGPGEAVWPNLSNQRLRLTVDRTSYKPGDTAQVFVPNPFNSSALALVTVERATIQRSQTVSLEPGGSTLSFPLTSEDAPNVFVSVTLLGRDAKGQPDFRQGFAELTVDPVEQTLTVSLASQPQRAGPGEDVTFDLLVSNAAGKPVQGEFSLSVVDLAALALADPNSPDILPAFYGRQYLGVRTSLALAAYARRQAFNPAEGRGGGGGDMSTLVVRERFPDTAFWNAEIVTGPDGKAAVTVPLPDTLTTWQVDVRGVADDTRVGQAKLQVVTTKDVLIRPITPRFLVAGDHAQLAAIVQNNTAGELQAEVSLQTSGFDLDDPATATQQATIPPRGRVRVEWWGTAQDTGSVDLVFSARSGNLQDAARPDQGALPVLHYTARQAFNTSGTLDEGGERLELVSLPRSFDPGAGNLKVELTPSLAAALLGALDALEHYPYECTEQTLSRFLPNLETSLALQQLNIQAPDLQARLDRTLDDGLQRLLSSQNSDGGWSWWRRMGTSEGSSSDPFITTYVLYGLERARQAGIKVNEEVTQRAIDYLWQNPPDPRGLKETWELDRLVFRYYALSQDKVGDLISAKALYGMRDQLSPWAQALLALTLERLSPDNAQAKTLLSDLQAAALRSSTGTHWEAPDAGGQNMITTISNSAFVIYALAQRDPKTPLLADAVRYLMAHRQADAGWGSTYSTAWSVMALTEFMKGTGELGGNFDFSAALNGTPLASGLAGGEQQLTPVTAETPLSNLYPDSPNALLIQRATGPGRLYYSAALQVNRPVAEVAPLSQGLSLSRAFYPDGKTCRAGDCAPLQSAQAGEKVTVRLTLTLPQDVYYLIVEDYIPAGAEILNTTLKTSQQGEGEGATVQTLFDPRTPFETGWGWWYFHDPEIHDERIAWAADYLPAGTYEFTYTLVILQPGAYQVIPARAWEFYFPDVQGNSAGEVFEIKP